MTSFTIFGPVHFAWLAVCGVLLFVFLRVYGRMAPGIGTDRFIRVFSAATLALHLIQSLWRIYEGSFGLDTLPIHICAIASYLCYVYRWFPSKAVGEILFFPCLPGAFAAILFPNWTYYPPLSVITVTGFLSHLAIGLTVLMRIGDGTLQPSLRRAYVPLAFMALYAAAVVPFNRHFHMNYGFLAEPSPGSPLVFVESLFGSGIRYFTGYLLFALALLLLCYGLCSLWQKKRRLSSAAPPRGC